MELHRHGYTPRISSPLNPRRQYQNLLAPRRSRQNERATRRKLEMSPFQQLQRYKAATAWHELSQAQEASRREEEMQNLVHMNMDSAPMYYPLDNPYAMIEEFLIELEQEVSGLQLKQNEHDGALQQRPPLCIHSVALSVVQNLFLAIGSWVVVSIIGIQGLLYCMLAMTPGPKRLATTSRQRGLSL